MIAQGKMEAMKKSWKRKGGKVNVKVTKQTEKGRQGRLVSARK